MLWKGKATHVAHGEGNMSCSQGVGDTGIELSCGMAASSLDVCCRWTVEMPKGVLKNCFERGKNIICLLPL